VTTALVIGLARLAAAVAIALVLGRALRLADVCDDRLAPDMRRDLDAVIAGLEADLRAAAGRPAA
jgi:hypothetical protein